MATDSIIPHTIHFNPHQYQHHQQHSSCHNNSSPNSCSFFDSSIISTPATAHRSESISISYNMYKNTTKNAIFADHHIIISMPSLPLPRIVSIDTHMVHIIYTCFIWHIISTCEYACTPICRAHTETSTPTFTTYTYIRTQDTQNLHHVVLPVMNSDAHITLRRSWSFFGISFIHITWKCYLYLDLIFFPSLCRWLLSGVWFIKHGQHMLPQLCSPVPDLHSSTHSLLTRWTS